MTQQSLLTVSTDASSPQASDPGTNRCVHTTAAGRRCRSLVFDPLFGLCRRHAVRAQKQRSDEDFASALLGDVTSYKSAGDLNKVLANLLVLVAQNRISPRRAAVVTYVTNQLLQTLTAMRREKKDEPTRIILDVPRPRRNFDDQTTLGSRP